MANLKSDYQLPHVCLCLFAWNDSSPTGRIFTKFYFFSIVRKLDEKLQIPFKTLTRITDSLHEYQYIFFVISRWIIRRMFHTKAVEKTTTYILCSINVFQKKKCRVWDNFDKYGRSREGTDNNIIWRKRLACWIMLQTHSQNIYHLLLSTAKIVTRKRLNVTTIRTLPVLLLLAQ